MSWLKNNWVLILATIIIGALLISEIVAKNTGGIVLSALVLVLIMGTLIYQIKNKKE